MPRALVVIDIQNDYFPGGRMELVGPEAAAANARTLLDGFRASGEPLFHIQHVMEEGGPFFVRGTEGVEIHSSVTPLEGERLIVKHYANSFKETPLREELLELKVDELVVCGMMTSMCVDATSRAGDDLGFKVTIAADACAAPSLPSGGELIPGQTVHRAFLAALDGMVATISESASLL